MDIRAELTGNSANRRVIVKRELSLIVLMVFNKSNSKKEVNKYDKNIIKR